MAKKKMLTVNEASEVLRCHPVTVRVACEKGEIPGAVRVGRMWRIPASIGTQTEITQTPLKEKRKSVSVRGK